MKSKNKNRTDDYKEDDKKIKVRVFKKIKVRVLNVLNKAGRSFPVAQVVGATKPIKKEINPHLFLPFSFVSIWLNISKTNR